MSADHVLSVTYCMICGISLIPLTIIVFKSLKRRKESRDFYSISTFFFLILMLVMRAITLIPIFIKDEDFNNYDSFCEETVFAGTPILLFNIAILIHTFRWFKIQSKLMSGQEPFKYSSLLLIVCIVVILSFLTLGYCLYCTDNKLYFVQELFDYLIATCHCVIQIMLIIFNIYIFIVFTRGLNNCYPILYSKIRRKLNFFFIILIALLIIRLLGVIPLAIDYHKPNDMIIPSFETLIFCFTEFFPVLMLMFSFITFGSSSNDDIESIEEFNDTIERSSSKVMRESDIYEYNYTHFSINNNSIAENSATQKLISQLKLDEHKSLDQHAASEQVNASILCQEIETDDENSSKGRDTIPKNRETKEFDQNPQENDGANNGEGIIFRDDHLKCAFKQMIGEMGMSRPSNFSLSALDENSDSD